ncbi:MAG: hypothetical protein M1826_000101 [Phylliscum demangeonii]|nr:MAG: hypothetical protein M1826_000101 [Phylliscum demangeonii]
MTTSSPMPTLPPRTCTPATGTRIKHPASTHFYDDQPPSSTKRLRRSLSLESGPSGQSPDSLQDGERRPRLARAETTISGDDGDEAPGPEAEAEGGVAAGRASGDCRTELETAMPAVSTDALADYEASKAAHAADTREAGGEGEERLGPDGRPWVKGRSSIYVDAFNLALDTVLADEAHLVDEAEQAVFRCWRELSYEAQYLYVRLFLRKTSRWHRINRIGYHGDIADMARAVDELQAPHALPDSSSSTPDVLPAGGGLAVPAEERLHQTFAFADQSAADLTTLDEAAALLNLEELKTLAKESKVHGRNKAELLAAFKRTSRVQSGLGEWRSQLQRTASEDTTRSSGSGSADIEPDVDVDDAPEHERARTGGGSSREAYFVRKILGRTGACIRLGLGAVKLFERVHLVFYRSSEWTEKSLTTIILARLSRRNFPRYTIARSANVFASRGALLEFEAALRTQARLEALLELPTTADGLGRVRDILDDVYPRWTALVDARAAAEAGRPAAAEAEGGGDSAYLRRFSPAWVYTRIVHKAAAVLGRLKEHGREHGVLTALLRQRAFHPARRGGWYQRKALLEEHYLWQVTLTPTPTPGPEPATAAETAAETAAAQQQAKKYWKTVALATCAAGLQDRDCHLLYHHDLQKRIAKLERALKVPKRLQHDFGHVALTKPVERVVLGIQVVRARSDRDDEDDPRPAPARRGAQTVWLDGGSGDDRDSDDPAHECSVEAMCLTWYRTQHGWKGYHAEGGIVRTLFAYLFYDLLFACYVPDVFQTGYQTCPLDLHSDAFYPARAPAIHARLAAISNGAGAAEALLRAVHAAHAARQTCVVGLDWSFALHDLLEIVRCFPPPALATVLLVLAQEYPLRGSGLPDLFLWHPGRRCVCFVEVKSANDRLSDAQRLWIHVLLGAGVPVELCLARPSEVRCLP